MGGVMTPKQARFVVEYLVDGNATQAAIRAGYSERTAGKIGGENLQKPEIKAAIAAAESERLERVKLSADYVLSSLQVVAERCLQRVPVMVRRGREMVQAQDDRGRHVWRFDSAGANRALELLGSHLKLFKEPAKGSADDPVHNVSMSLEQWRAERAARQAQAAQAEHLDDEAGDG